MATLIKKRCGSFIGVDPWLSLLVIRWCRSGLLLHIGDDYLFNTSQCTGVRVLHFFVFNFIGLDTFLNLTNCAHYLRKCEPNFSKLAPIVLTSALL